ncbi:MAG: type 4a pilus biogenesis protein PilO [Methylococcales bacterium]|nr:type 4a pilus biogenesis protein PilO [Methylococcales bacterium]
MIDTYPELQALAQLKTEKSKLKNILINQNLQTQHYTEALAELIEIEVQLNSLIKAIPAQDELNDQLIEISKIGVEQGLKFELFKPMPAINQELFTEHPISIKIIGSYAEICLFASGLSTLPRLVTLSEINLESVNIKGKLIMTGIISSYNEKNPIRSISPPEPNTSEQ